MPLPTVLDRLQSTTPAVRRARRRLTPAVRSLEGRLLLSALPVTATMTQTATFPNLESQPNVSDAAILYFSSSIGTLTEVDVVTSGSYTTQFYAENLGATSSKITGTTSGNLSINLPTGPMPVTIPSLTESFNAAPYDGTVNYGGTSGKDFAAESSSSTTNTTVMTSPADLAAFTGQFRIPITVSGHATGSASSSNGDLSDGFSTQTSVTLTVIYHYTSVTSTNPPTSTGSGGTTPTPGTPVSPSPSPTGSAPSAPSGTGSQSQPVVTLPQHSSKQGTQSQADEDIPRDQPRAAGAGQAFKPRQGPSGSQETRGALRILVIPAGTCFAMRETATRQARSVVAGNARSSLHAHCVRRVRPPCRRLDGFGWLALS